jgi:penicillin-binding protein 1A
MATAYSVFANGGYRVNPWLIAKVSDHKGKVLSQTTAPSPADLPRAIEARNAFVMNSLLQEITRSGTAARTQATLKRPDLYGKTGTTNDSVDAWFAGFQPTIAAVTWIGYDTPRNLGSRETGGGLSLPVWISFMEKALKGVPVMEPDAPPGVVNSGGEWFYEEKVRIPGIAGASLDDRSATAPNAAPVAPPPQEERNRILDLFRN